MARVRNFMVAVVAALAMASSAFAGPVIIDGTDANDHGSFSGGANQAGWLYMERVLENIESQLSPSVTSNNLTVLGIANVSSQARNAIQSAYSQSLQSLGWTISYIDGAAAINTFLSTTMSTSNTGILHIASAGNSSGDMDATELAQVNANAVKIQQYVAAGGGLHAMAESVTGAWGWLTTLIPGIVATDVGGGGIGTDITLTPAGMSAFPGLTNAQLAGADPWHGHFSGNLGTLSVLGTALQGASTRNVIIGGGTETVISAPFPASVLLLGFGAGIVLCLRRRHEV